MIFAIMYGEDCSKLGFFKHRKYFFVRRIRAIIAAV
jgi:hypothetical protein